MAYRITYTVNVDWVGEGVGPMSGNTAAQVGDAPAGGAQRLKLFNAAGGQNRKTFQAADITALTNAMAVDIAAQMTTNIARVQGFATGGG
jgi:hypothetical protein